LAVARHLVARELADEVGMRVRDVALDVCDQLVVVLTGNDDTLSLALKRPRHSSSVRSFLERWSQRPFPEAFADLS
jgi:hypothetical protein